MAGVISTDEATTANPDLSPEAFFTLGMECSIGGDVPSDLVSAHKWFNLAAMKGNQEAVRLRREIAEQMSNTEIGAAQRAARDFIKLYPSAFAPPAPRLNAAA